MLLVPCKGLLAWLRACGSVDVWVCLRVHAHTRDKDDDQDADQDKQAEREAVKISDDLSRTGAVVRMSRGSQWDGGNENTAYPGHVGAEKLKKDGARTPKKESGGTSLEEMALIAAPGH